MPARHRRRRSASRTNAWPRASGSRRCPATTAVSRLLRCRPAEQLDEIIDVAAAAVFAAELDALDAVGRARSGWRRTACGCWPAGRTTSGRSSHSDSGLPSRASSALPILYFMCRSLPDVNTKNVTSLGATLISASASSVASMSLVVAAAHDDDVEVLADLAFALALHDQLQRAAFVFGDGREPDVHDVDADVGEPAADLVLRLRRIGDAAHLLAVAQRRVVDAQFATRAGTARPW